MECAAIDGITTDLRTNRKYIMDAMKGVAKFAPSNDIEGDCGTTLASNLTQSRRQTISPKRQAEPSP